MARHLLTRSQHETAAEPDRGPGADEDRSRPGAQAAPVLPVQDFRGTNWGACFFGWLVAVGVTILLGCVVGAIAGALAAARGWTEHDARSSAATVALVGVIAVAVVELVGYYAGGYVAGRMSRFDAGRQGFGVWLIGVLTLVIVGGVLAILGTRYHWIEDLDRSSVDLSDSQATVGGIVAAAAVLALMLVGALLGSAVGRNYHRRVDRVLVEH